MKKLLLLIMACASIGFASAQQKTITENILIYTPWVDFSAPMTYSYTVSDDGKRIKNGPISISGRQNWKYDNSSITGTYTLKASAKNGHLNGLMTVTARYQGVTKKWSGNKIENLSYSFRGNFLNGIPNGNFTSNATGHESVNVTYKNGILVGAYKVGNTRGTLSNSGKMIGVWYLDDDRWEFINGVRISKSSKYEESTPKQIAMAKKYASGAISAEEAKKQGYVPVEDSISLGGWATNALLLDYIANWKKLAHWDFSKGRCVKYTYLYNILPLPDKEFDEFLTKFKNNGRVDNQIEFDKKGNCYTAKYYVNYGTPDVEVKTGRITDEQLSQINETIDYYCRNNPTQISSLINSDKSYDIQTYLSQRLEYIEEEENIYNAYNSCTNLISEVQGIKYNIKRMLNGKKKTSDNLFYIIPYDEKYHPFSLKYFPASKLNDLESLEQEATKVLDNLTLSIYKQTITSTLNLIIKQSDSKVVKKLNPYIFSLPEAYYKQASHKNTVSIEEFAKAIAKVEEFQIINLEKENVRNTESYRATIEFKKKEKKEGITIRASISFAQLGKNIINNTFVILNQ